MGKTIVITADAPAAIGPYSQGVRVGQFLYTSGQIPLDPKTGELVGTGIVDQTRRVLENLQAVLRAGGARLDQVVKTTVFLVDLHDFAKVNELYAIYFSNAPPARSTVQVAELPRGARIEIEAVAYLGAD